jgi:uncharacterized UPF0160 family protein
MYKNVSQDTLYKSFRQFESYITKQVSTGKMNNHYARDLLSNARKNYREQNLNRQLEKINAGNTKESILHV